MCCFSAKKKRVFLVANSNALPNQVVALAVNNNRTVSHENLAYHELKSRIHEDLLNRMDLAVMESLPHDRLLAEIKALVERLLVEERTPINDTERQRIIQDIQHEILGLGPLEPLLADPTISDILVNTHRQVFV